MTVRKPIPTSITSAATSFPATLVGTWSPYPTVVTVWTAHQSPDPIDGKFLRSATVISIPAPTVIAVDTVAITTAAPRGLVAWATMTVESPFEPRLVFHHGRVRGRPEPILRQARPFLLMFIPSG